jgi:putative transposase
VETPWGVYKRLERREVAEGARFITCGCYHRLPLFRNDAIKAAFVEALGWACERFEWDLWAWVVMINHTHFIASPRAGAPPFNKGLAQLKARVANRVLARWRELGAPVLGRLRDAQDKERFWQRGGGYDRNLWSPRHIWEAIDYIHQNPVVARLCTRSSDWPWSSAAAFWGGENRPLHINFERIPNRPSK